MTLRRADALRTGGMIYLNGDLFLLAKSESKDGGTTLELSMRNSKGNFTARVLPADLIEVWVPVSPILDEPEGKQP